MRFRDVRQQQTDEEREAAQRVSELYRLYGNGFRARKSWDTVGQQQEAEARRLADERGKGISPEAASRLRRRIER